MIIETEPLIPSLIHLSKSSPYLANIYLFWFNNRNTGNRFKICSKLTIKTQDRRHWRRSVIVILNFEQISHIVLVFPLLILKNWKISHIALVLLLSNLNKYMPAGMRVSERLFAFFSRHCKVTWKICTFRTGDEEIKRRWSSLETLCVIWKHLYNFKNVKNTHGGVLLLVTLQTLKVTLLHGCFSRF